MSEESLKIGLQIHKGKKNPPKFMTNNDTSDNIQINGTETEKVTNNNYLGKTIAMENRTRQEVSARMKTGWSAFGKHRELFLDRHLPMDPQKRKKGLRPVCLTSSGVRIPNTVSSLTKP